jgi:hypothetical protein
MAGEGVERFRLQRAVRTADSYINNQIGRAIGGIDNPILRQGAQNFLDSILPGVGGGTPDLRDNVFRDKILTKQAQVISEQQRVINAINNTQTNDVLSKSFDWRARLRPKEGGAGRFYSAKGFDDYLMQPIEEAGGLIFPNTPSVIVATNVNYDQSDMQGQNYPILTYRNTQLQPLNVASSFTANDIYEARYMLAMLTFIRIATKAYYGDSAVEDGNNVAGTPPPVLLFEYLGDHGFNKVPVVMSSYSTTFPDDVDYIPVVTGTTEKNEETVTYMPTKMDVSILLTPSYTPQKMRRKFDLAKIANGINYTDGFI